MPKESVQIRSFDGMFGLADERDLRSGMAVYARNLNMITSVGAFEALPDDLSWGYAVAGGAKVFIPYLDGDKAVYYNGTAVVIVEDLAATPSTLTPTDEYGDDETTMTGSQTGVSDGEYVRMGMGGTGSHAPMWVGQPQHGLFGALAPTGPLKTHATLLSDPIQDQPNIGAPLTTWLTDFVGTYTSNEEEVVFKPLTAFQFYASITYDGYQEGPLFFLGYVIPLPNTGTQLGLSALTLTVRVITGGASATEEQKLSKRATAINIYRSTHDYLDTNLLQPQYIATHIFSMDITSATGWSDTSWDSGNMVGKEFDVVDQGFSGRTYEERTSINPTLGDWSIHYGISCLADSYHVVGDVWHADMGSRPSMLIRSKYARYDTFDWSVDWLVLPTEPVALESYAGRVFAFSPGFTYIINPDSMSIEDTIEGIGALAPQSVVKTDRGMFWADINNVYWHDGSRIKPIAAPIMRQQHPSYGFASYLGSTISTSNPPTLFYSSRYDSLVIIYKYSTTTYGWMFHLESERWVHLSFATNGTVQGSFIGPDGTPRFVINNSLYSFGVHPSTYRNWVFVSHDLVTDPGEWHIYYHAIVSYQGSAPDAATLDFYDGDPEYVTAEAWTSIGSIATGLYRGQINKRAGGDWDRVKNFSIGLVESGTTRINDVTLIRRRITAR